MSAIYLRAPAKINLAFEVIGPRPDGYHNVSTVMQAIGIMDEVILERVGSPVASDDTLVIEPRLNIPGGNNYVLQAVQMLRKGAGIPCDDLSILLRKSIPISAGMGGGSSDAAAVLRGIPRLYGRYVPNEEILLLAREIGSDVPFFLECATGMGSGRGDIVMPLPAPIERCVVVAPLESVRSDKTAWMYSLLSSRNYSPGGERTMELVQCLREGARLNDCLFNTFDDLASSAYADYDDTRNAFIRSGSTRVMLAGSGPSIFSLCDDRVQAIDLQRRLMSRGVKAVTAPLLSAW